LGDRENRVVKEEGRERYVDHRQSIEKNKRKQILKIERTTQIVNRLRYRLLKMGLQNEAFRNLPALVQISIRIKVVHKSKTVLD
jgi:hypothetical protein